MRDKHKKQKFTNTLTFKILFGIAVLFILGLLYNFVIKSDEKVTEEQIQAEQERNATLDTLDIIGDYLWAKQKPAKEDLTDKEKAIQAEKTKENTERLKNKTNETDKKEREEVKSGKSVIVPMPAPATEPIHKNVPIPSIEKISAPKIEKIEQ